MSNFNPTHAHLAVDLFAALQGAHRPGSLAHICWEQDFGAAPVAIFLQGLPAAGKSTIVARYFVGWHVIDSDVVKASHPDYDPKNPSPLHDWSKAIAEDMTAQALDAGRPHIVDGTGTDGDKLTARMNRARGAGFVPVLLHVRCRLETSLRRNAARARVGPPAILVEKAGQVLGAFEDVLPAADVVVVVHNDAHGLGSGLELQVQVNRLWTGGVR